MGDEIEEEGNTCDPFVLGPELAIDRIPAPVCFKSFVISSSNLDLSKE